MKNKSISVVTPIYNEEVYLGELNERLSRILKEITQDYEIIYVNDGSTDNSLRELLSFREKDKRIKIINLSRNFGQQQALNAGLDNVSGELIVLIDSDLQDRPEDIKLFYDKIVEGYDVVYAIRKERKESFLKVLCSRLFYRTLNKLSTIRQPLDSGVFSMMKRPVACQLCRMPERNKYIAGLRAFIGFRQIGIPLQRDERKHNLPRNRLFNLSKLAFDAIFSFSYIPLRLSALIGLVSSGVCFCWFFYVSLVTVLHYFHVIDVKGVVRGLPTILLFQIILGSLMLICLGIVGEYIGRIYDEVKQRPYYIIMEKFGDFQSKE